jgi:hypothetical protein
VDTKPIHLKKGYLPLFLMEKKEASPLGESPSRKLTNMIVRFPFPAANALAAG